MSKGITKEALASDLIDILNSNIDTNMKKICANYVIYTWTEYDGKYEDNAYWSLEALKYYKQKNRQGKLVHEHIIPRRLIIDKLLNLGKDRINMAIETDIKNTEVYQILNNECIGAIITKEEDNILNEVKSKSKSLRAIMPEEYYDLNNKKYYLNPWARYYKANEENLSKGNFNKLITIFNIKNDAVVIIKSDKEKIKSIYDKLELIAEINSELPKFDNLKLAIYSTYDYDFNEEKNEQS